MLCWLGFGVIYVIELFVVFDIYCIRFGVLLIVVVDCCVVFWVSNEV